MVVISHISPLSETFILVFSFGLSNDGWVLYKVEFFIIIFYVIISFPTSHFIYIKKTDFFFSLLCSSRLSLTFQHIIPGV